MISLADNLHDDEDGFGAEEAIPEDASPADPRRFRVTYRQQRWYKDHLPACDISGPADFKARKVPKKDQVPGGPTELPLEVDGPYFQQTKTGLVDLVKGVPKPMIVPSFTTISNAWPQEFMKNVKDANGNKYRVPLDSLRTADWFLDNYALVSQLPRETARALGAQFAKDELDRAADRGTDVHLIIEGVALGNLDKSKIPVGLWDYIDPIKEWFDTVQPEVLFTEVVGFNWDLPYACTADLVLRIQNWIWYFDAKSKGFGSDGVLGNHGIYEKNTAQVAAAANVEYFIVERDGVAVRVRPPKGDFGGIMSCRPDGVMTFPTDLEAGWVAMQNMVHCWAQLRDGRSAAREAIMKTKSAANKSVTAYLDVSALARGEFKLLPFEKGETDDESWSEPTFEIPTPPAAAPADDAEEVFQMLDPIPVPPPPPPAPAQSLAVELGIAPDPGEGLGFPQSIPADEAVEILYTHEDGLELLDAITACEVQAELTPVAAAELEQIMNRPENPPVPSADEPKAIYGPDPAPGIIKVLVTGSRDLAEDGGQEAVWAELDRVHATCMRMVVVHGGCPTGADAYASEWVAHRAAEPMGPHHQVHEWVFGARWVGFGQSAGPLRNREMVLVARPGMTLAFAAGGSLESSRGTANCVSAVRSAIVNPVVHVHEHLPVDPSLRAKEKELRAAANPKPVPQPIPATQSEFNELPAVVIPKIVAPDPSKSVTEQVAAEPFETAAETAAIAQEAEMARWAVPPPPAPEPVIASTPEPAPVAPVALVPAAPVELDINPQLSDYAHPEVPVIPEVPAGYTPDNRPEAPPMPDDLAVARIAEVFDATEVTGEELAAELAYAGTFRFFASPTDITPAPREVSIAEMWEYVKARITYSIEGDGSSYLGNPQYGPALKQNWTVGEPAQGVPPQCPGIPFSLECPPMMENVLTVLALVDALDSVAGVPFAAIVDPRTIPASHAPSAVAKEGGLVSDEHFAALMAMYGSMEQPEKAATKKVVNDLLGQARAANADFAPGESMRTKRRCAILSCFFLIGDLGYQDETFLRAMLRYVLGADRADLTPGAIIGKLNLIGAQGLLTTILNVHSGVLEARYEGDQVVLAAPRAVAA